MGLDAVTDEFVLFSAGKAYYGIAVSRDVASRLAARGDVIVGIEGFSTDGEHIHPLSDYIGVVVDNEEPIPSPAVAAGRAMDLLTAWSGSPVMFVRFTAIRNAGTFQPTA